MKSSCEITFEGLNIGRLLTLLGKSNITLYKVERDGKKCTIRVASTHAKHTIALLQERCYNIIGVKYFGISAAAKFVKKRFVLPIFCLLIVVVLLLASQFCFKIEISGDFDKQAVQQALTDAGVTIGCNLSKLNVDALENTLSNKMNAMYAVVTRSGSVLYVNVVARKQIDPPIDMTERRDIVATRAGVVTSVLCEQGNACVKVGDYVSVGDVLIEGRRVFNDGTSVDVYALGNVTLQISATGFAEYNGYKTSTVETGNIFKCTGVVLFGKEYRKPCPFESYTLTTTTTRLFPLNLQICQNVFYETQTVTVAATLDECLDELKEKALKAAQDNCDFVVTDVNYDVTAAGVTATLVGACGIN